MAIVPIVSIVSIVTIVPIEPLIEAEVLVGVADEGKVSLEILEADDHRPTAVVGVEGQGFAARVGVVAVVEQCLVEEEVYMVLFIVDEAEWRDTAGFQSEVLHHALRRGERELAGCRLPL